MRKRVVIFNCPPGAGKDLVANKSPTLKFSDKLIEIALTISGIDKEKWSKRYATQKDISWDLLGNLSQRQYIKHLAENVIKPIHGSRYFGEHTLKSIKKSSEELLIITDGGFAEEVSVLLEDNGLDVLILQWGRDGCRFDDDSRSFVMDFPDITIRLDDNNGCIEEFRDYVFGTISNHFNL